MLISAVALLDQAEELGVPLNGVCVELGETERVPWDRGTFGSLSIATDGQVIRSAASYARTLLLKRASILFGIPLSLKPGTVIYLRGTEGLVSRASPEIPRF